MSTTAPLSETAIANMGAMLLDDQPMLALTDGTSAFARFCQREFGYVRDEMLRAHPWSFNKIMAALTTDTEPPAFRWKYAYTLPSDCLRIHTIRDKVNGPKTAYEKFGRKIYTDVPTVLYIVYGARVTNASEFDPLFGRALGYRLGLMGAQLVTGKTTYVDRAKAMYTDAMGTAIHVDSLEQGDNTYVDNGFNGAMPDSLSVRGR